MAEGGQPPTPAPPKSLLGAMPENALKMKIRAPKFWKKFADTRPPPRMATVGRPTHSKEAEWPNEGEGVLGFKPGIALKQLCFRYTIVH